MAFSEAVKHPSTPVELSPAGNEPLNTLEVCAGDSVRDGLKGNSFVVEKYLDALCLQFIWKQIGKVTTTGVSKRMCQKDFDDLMASCIYGGTKQRSISKVQEKCWVALQGVFHLSNVPRCNFDFEVVLHVALIQKKTKKKKREEMEQGHCDQKGKQKRKQKGKTRTMFAEESRLE